MKQYELIVNNIINKYDPLKLDIYKFANKLNFTLKPNGYVYRVCHTGDNILEFNHLLNRKDLNYFVIYEVVKLLYKKYEKNYQYNSIKNIQSYIDSLCLESC